MKQYRTHIAVVLILALLLLPSRIWAQNINSSQAAESATSQQQEINTPQEEPQTPPTTEPESKPEPEQEPAIKPPPEDLAQEDITTSHPKENIPDTNNPSSSLPDAGMQDAQQNIDTENQDAKEDPSPVEPPIHHNPYESDSLVNAGPTTWPQPQADILQAYAAASPEYLKIALQSQLSQNKESQHQQRMDSAKEQINSIGNLITATQQQLDDYIASGNIIGQLTSQAALENYKAQLTTQEEAYAAYGLERDLASYQAQASNLILDAQQRQAQYRFYQIYAAIPMQRAQLQYWSCTVQGLELALNDEKQKLYHGYSTEAKLLQKEADLQAAKAQQAAAAAVLHTSQQTVQLHCGNVDLQNIALLPFPPVQPATHYISRFMQGSIQHQQTQVQILAYQRYIDYASLYLQTKPDTQALQRQLLELQAQQYTQIDLPLYIQHQLDAITQGNAQLAATAANLLAAKAEDKAARLLLEKGMLTPLQQTQSTTKIAQLIYQEQNLLYQISLAAYALEYGIETPLP